MPAHACPCFESLRIPAHSLPAAGATFASALIIVFQFLLKLRVLALAVIDNLPDNQGDRNHADNRDEDRDGVSHAITRFVRRVRER